MRYLWDVNRALFNVNGYCGQDVSTRPSRGKRSSFPPANHGYQRKGTQSKSLCFCVLICGAGNRYLDNNKNLRTSAY